MPIVSDGKAWQFKVCGKDEVSGIVKLFFFFGLKNLLDLKPDLDGLRGTKSVAVMQIMETW